MNDDCQMTSMGPMYLTFVSVGFDMIHFTGHPRIALSNNPLNIRPEAEQNQF